MINISGRDLSINQEPYIIAELSANHGGSINRAINTISAAKKAGADAIKIQTYNADSMTLNSDKDDFIIKEGTWKGYKLYELYNEASTPYKWHKKLFEHAKEIGITIFSTPFDEEAVDLLEELNTPAYKIASFEIVDLPLIKYIAEKGKPLLISTGMSSKEEIDEAIKIAKDYGSGEVLLFHCISSYPAKTSDSNIAMIKTLNDRYELDIGLSDHTLNNTAALAAVALGACAIEKHFILNKKDKSPDSTFSIDPKELKSLKKDTKDCWESIGKGNFQRANSETKNIVFRRSLYFARDINEGQFITKKDIRRIRPGYGLAPKYFEEILGCRLIKRVEIGDPVTWDCLKKDNNRFK